MGSYEERMERTKWFREERFGMFIHWGLYSVPARGEWLKSRESITDEEYQTYFDAFDPTDYDPKTWARLAREAGMKYAVMTAKHHDGFCLFDSEYTDYKATNTKAGRDLIREYVDAFRAEGIRVGLYYSLIDWHHPDFPHYKDAFHPYRADESTKDVPRDFSRYLTYLRNQVRELLTNYGKIDMMWFDFSYDDMTDETWEATKLVEMMRSLQPDIVIDDRLAGSGAGAQKKDWGKLPYYAGDYASPEQIVPGNGMTDTEGRQLPWESCMTLNDNWGYHKDDTNYKSADVVVKMLVECVSKGGNMLINVGPTAKGEIPKQAEQILREVGVWMHQNKSSIYGCGASELPKPQWGRYTQKGNRLYAHIYERGSGAIRLEHLKGKIESAYRLSDGAEMKVIEPWNAEAYAEDAFVEMHSAVLPDPLDTVLELHLKK